MYLQPRLAAATAVCAILLTVAGAAPATQPVPAIDVTHSPTKKTGARSGASAALEGVTAPAAKPTETAADGPERLRQRLAAALAAAGGKSTAPGTPPPALQIVNRRQPSAQREMAIAPHPQRIAAAGKTASATPAPSGIERLALVPGSTARLAAVQTPTDVKGTAARAPAPNAAALLPWAYDGPSGPHAWAELRPEYATCGTGLRQSPIDLRDGLKLQLEPIVFSYLPSTIRVIDTGRTVQVDVGAGNWLEVMGRRFELQQFHFHKPSEERIDGRRFDMGAHLVHRDQDGRLAIVAVLLTRGAAQPLIQTVWNNLPLEKGSDQPVAAPIDLNALLPTARGYFAYMGSLAEPPCTEDVLWLVMKSPVEISAQQIAIFDRLYPMNARPLQATAGRLIKESE